MLHERIKEQRNKRRLSQAELARLLGVSQQTIGSWEVNRTSPDVEMLKNISRALDCALEYFLGITDNPEYTADNFMLNNKLIAIIKLLAIYDNDPPYFSPEVAALIKNELQHLKNIYTNIDFGLTPNEMIKFVRECDNFALKEDLKDMMLYIKGKIPPVLPLRKITNLLTKEVPPSDSLNDVLENITLDYMKHLQKNKESIAQSDLSIKENRDIARDLEKILSDLDSDNAMAFNGEPMDEDDKELLRISLENSMRLAKQIAKKKFTPKKYRKEE